VSALILEDASYQSGADTQVCPYVGLRDCIYFSKTISLFHS